MQTNVRLIIKTLRALSPASVRKVRIFADTLLQIETERKEAYNDD